MWDLDHKKGWAPNRCFQIVVLEKTPECPLDCKEIKPVNPKEINPKYSLEGLLLKLQYFGHLIQRADTSEKEMLEDREAWRAVVHEGHREVDTIKKLNNNNIWISEVLDIYPSNLDSSLGFIQPGISHDVLCIEVK